MTSLSLERGLLLTELIVICKSGILCTLFLLFDKLYFSHYHKIDTWTFYYFCVSIYTGNALLFVQCELNLHCSDHHVTWYTIPLRTKIYTKVLWHDLSWTFYKTRNNNYVPTYARTIISFVRVAFYSQDSFICKQ